MIADTPTVAADAVDEDMCVFDIFETDTSAEEDGRWFDIFGDKSKGEIKIRSFGSKASLNVRRRLEARYRRQMKGDGTYPVEVMQKIVEEQIAHSIVVDWRGPAWRNRDGSPLPFSPATVLALVQKAPHLRNKIASLAGDMDAFRAADQEAIVKN